MNELGKYINLFLLDGTLSGCIKCWIPYNSGIAYKIPLIKLIEVKEIKDLNNAGVYFLFGKNDDTGDSVVYIGQANNRKSGEGILNRLIEHANSHKKDYLTEAVVITTTDNSFGSTEICYLENRFHDIAKQVGRYTMDNKEDPSLGNITKEKEIVLEGFIGYAKLLMGALGYKIFEPLIAETIETTEKNDEQQLLFFNNKKVNATGKVTSKGFVVIAGSTVAPKPTPKCPDYIKDLRKQHANKILEGKLKEDILFTAPSRAASFVAFGSRSGNEEWKDGDGKKLKYIDVVEQNDEQPLLYFSYNNANATGIVTSEGFVVMKGSTACPVNPDKQCRDNIKVLREQHKNKISEGKLIEDILFTTPSAAASFLAYGSLSGNEYWKDGDGKKLKDIKMYN